MLVLRPDEAFSRLYATDDLAAKSLRGGAVTMAAQLVQFALQICGTIVLARLLSPDDFGLVGMVTVLTAFARLLREAGLSTATIQRRSITADQCSNLFWANLALGVFLALCVAGAAPLVARFFGRSELTGITIGLAITVGLGGLSTQHAALLERSMRFGAAALTGISFQVAYLLSGAILALRGYGYWSLVGATIIGSAVVPLLTFALCPWIPSRPKRGTGAARLVRFGQHVLGFNVVNYFSTNTDNLLVGRFLGAIPLGLYSRAYNFFALPMVQIRTPIERVGLPTLRLLVDDAERFRRYYVRLVNIVATLSVPVGLMCVVEGGFLIQVLLGSKWLAAVPAFRVLGAAMLIQPVVSTVGLVQLSLGQSRRYFLWGVVTAVVYIGSFVAGLPWGITGVAGAYAIANYLLLLPTAMYCLADSPIRTRDFLGGLVMPFAVGAVAAGLAWLATAMGPSGLHSQGAGLAVLILVYAGLSLARPSVLSTLRLLPGMLYGNSKGQADTSA